MILNVIIPVFNEIKTINIVVDNVLKFKELETKIIIVDDCSTDGTSEELKKIQEKNKEKILVIYHSDNLGKGSAIKTALKYIVNGIVIIQDADLEYSPDDYPNLIKPIISNNADVVYGSRFLGGGPVRIHLFWNFVANKLLTLLTNILVNMNFTDMETGYKLFKSEVIKDIDLKEKSFGIEPELTIKLAKKKLIFYEVPISYFGRSYEEGKKIKLRDAFIAFYCIIKYSILKK